MSKPYPIPQKILQDLVEVEKELISIATSAGGMLSEAATTILKAGGKRLRPALVLMSGMIGRYDLKLLMPAAVSSELIHLASLIHDDVLDNASVRRGVETINHKWGETIAIAAGDYLFAASFELLAKCDVKLVDVMVKAAIDLSLGELDQIETAHVVEQTFDDYLKKARRKTAALFSACCHVGALISGVPENEVKALTSYGDYLGIAFQIYDDVLDVAGGETTGKAVGVDVRDGTVTVPMLYALDYYGRDSEFAEIIRKQKPSDSEVKKAITLMLECDSVEKTKNTAKEFVDKAFAALKEIKNQEAQAIFRGIGEFVIERYH